MLTSSALRTERFLSTEQIEEWIILGPGPTKQNEVTSPLSLVTFSDMPECTPGNFFDTNKF